MSEAETRARIVAEARSWVGTPYHHCADIKGVGVDCGMLLVRVFVDLGILEPFDPRPYSHDWMLHRSEEIFLGHMLARAEIVDKPQPGDVMLFKVGRCYAHGSIVTVADPLTIIHAYLPYRRVVEEVVSTHAPLIEMLPTAKIGSFAGSVAQCLF